MTDVDLGAATTVLVTAPTGDSGGAGTCADLLGTRTEPLDRLIVVPVGSTPTAWQDDLSGRSELAETAVSYVDVKTAVRSDADGEPPAEEPTPAATISSPADLGSLGTVLNDGLAHAVDEGESVGVYLDSLSEMLQFVDREFLFKFLHTLGARIHRVDGVAYYHLDADAESDLGTLFGQITDAVVTVEDDGISVSAEVDTGSADADD